MSEIHTLPSSYSYLDPLFSGPALNASPPFSGSALNASPLSTDANASARHETKITFEFYGADALPKPANRPEGWSSGGTARTPRSENYYIVLNTKVQLSKISIYREANIAKHLYKVIILLPQWYSTGLLIKRFRTSLTLSLFCFPVIRFTMIIQPVIHHMMQLDEMNPIKLRYRAQESLSGSPLGICVESGKTLLMIPPPPPRPEFDSSREKLQKLGEGEVSMTAKEFNKMKLKLEAEALAT
ncbi:hypothetical protein OUZ56_026072 [Daphnia magna]|uniref:Uncharacterized protein n=1 Tax=Daphnia magna TaxID=35525 RepID=A0ABQ9ZKS1_9CRUS|nr:hypothetical protein OUZ56_026072 [Daphnia magna]